LNHARTEANVGVQGSRPRDIVVVGASAGGVEALTRFVSAFPPDLHAAVFIVLHVSPTGSVLPSILGRATPLPVAHAEDGQPIEHGRIYVAPPNCHMLVEDGRIRVTAGPRQNGHRPAIDPLFRTAAWAYGGRVVGVILSGVLDDGTLGCVSIAARGGVTLAQDPADATYDSMPLSAIEFDSATQVGSATELGRLVVELASDGGNNWPADTMEAVPVTEALEGDRERRTEGELSGLTCPECNGALWQFQEGDLLRFRCRVGHSYSTGAMDASQGTAVEAALWAALRALEERVALKRRLAKRIGAQSTRMRERYESDAAFTEEQAAMVRRLIDDLNAAVAGDEPVAGDNA
jgi:two-component system, chemotaxis family, protein-glutamate methylesterase/glutaminase